MAKPRTSKPRRRTRPQVLEVRVMSPRIAWFGFLQFAARTTKLALATAAVAAIGWGVWQGIQHAFHKNPDFRLQVIDLNPNPAIDEVGLADATGIDLTASLFDIDVEKIATTLKSLPEIADASAERHLPGKLVVRVVARTPRTWISSEGGRALLVDAAGFAYPCPPLQEESANELPTIVLPVSAEHPIVPGRRVTHPELARAFRLLDSACQADPQAPRWIESISQINEWSLRLVTREGTAATFGLGDHGRQMRNLRAAMDHSSQKGYAIDTINLIPKHNIPITLRGEPAAPPKAVPVPAGKDRRSRDLDTLLERN